MAPRNPIAMLRSVRQIEIVKALAKHRHFGLAAKALGVSQPALTRSLKQLEADLGVSLFDRQGVTPTLFGEIVLRHGERAAAEFHELMREITLAKGIEIGELRVAAGAYPADISATRAIGVLTAHHPRLTVELSIADWSRIAQGILENRVDLGLAEISEAERDPDLRTEAVRDSRGIFFCAADHPLAQKKGVALEDLLEYPWVGPLSADRAPFRTLTTRSDRSIRIRTVFIRASSSRPLPPRKKSSSPGASGAAWRARSSRNYVKSVW